MTETADWINVFYLQVYFVNTEKDEQLITLIIIFFTFFIFSKG